MDVLTCAPLFRISGTAGQIALKLGVWLSPFYTMRDSPVDSVRLLRVVGFCVKSVRKSSSLHSKCIKCATLQMEDVKSRKARTGRIKCTEEPDVQSIQSVFEGLDSVHSVKENPHVQEEPLPIKSSNV